jgi:integrase
MPATKNHRGWGHVRKLPSGKYQASYLGRDRHRHTALGTFDSKLNAEGWLANEKNYLDRCRMTGEAWKSPELRAEQQKAAVLLLRDYGKDWIAQRPIKESTRTEYESTWRNHIEPKLGAVALRDLSTEAIRAWYAGLGSNQPSRRKNAYSLLHSICKTALNDQLTERNPCQIDGAMTINRKREPEILTAAQLATVAAAMPDRLQALILLSAWCGLRWGEVTELRRKDINDDCTQITIARGVTHKGECRIGTTKSDKVRTGLIPSHIRQAVKAHLDEHVEADREALLFMPARGGCHLNDQVFAETWYRPALAKVKRESVRIHDLRHFGATMMSQIGASTAEVQVFLGHSTPHMAMRYTAAVEERRTVLADRISKLAESA